jgi:thiol-disulfide isomerase/thioredoxin
MANRAVRAISMVFMLIIVLAAGVAGYYYARVKPLIRAGRQQGIYASVPGRLSVGEFAFATENGVKKSIADLRGKAVVIDVWATWCGTCLHSIPGIVALRNKYTETSLEIIGLNVDDEGWAIAKPFLQKHPEINYTIALPSPAPSFLLQSIVDLKPLGEVSALPTVFVIDRQGRLAGKFIETGHEREIEDLVARLLSEPGGL